MTADLGRDPAADFQDFASELAAPLVVTEPGVYDMPDAAYHADPVPGGSLSSTGARRLLPPGCPALFRYEREHPVFKRVFDFGSAAHQLVLGAGAELVVVDADDWRTKAAREARDEARAEGKSPVLTRERDQVVAMAAAIRSHPVAISLFDAAYGRPEQSLFWRDPETGVWCRARPDWLPHDGPDRRLIVTDYKTADTADPGVFARSAASYGYHQQDAFYLDGIRALGLADDPAFLFVVQAKTPPYLVTLVELDDTARRAGRARNRQAIERYRDCTDTGIWPDHTTDPAGIELVSLPPWATRDLEEIL